MAALVLAVGLSGTAQAALYDRGGGLIYDTDLNVTWMQNANYGFGSNYDSADGITDGRMTWQNAVDWAANLSYYDNVRNVTYSDWRLPTVTDTGTSGCNFAYGGTDCGYNVDTATGEMAHLFYDELQNKAGFDTTAVDAFSDMQEGWGLTNVGPFTNLQDAGYWSGTEYAPYAWSFGFYDGWQGIDNKASIFYALAVRPGDVAAVPEAETWAMLLAGLGLVTAVVRHRKQANKSR
jgi:hypothetical protein